MPKRPEGMDANATLKTQLSVPLFGAVLGQPHEAAQYLMVEEFSSYVSIMCADKPKMKKSNRPVSEK